MQPEMMSQGDLPEGVTSVESAEAASETRRTVRAAVRGEADDPLEGLADRIRGDAGAAGKTELAFDPLVIAAAAELREEDGPAFDRLCRDLKAVKVALTRWNKAIDAHARNARATQREAERRASADALQLRQEQQARERAEREAERQHARAQADQGLALHYATATLDAAEFTMTPGRVTRTLPPKRGDGPDVLTTLSNFSPPITAELRDVALPGSAPELTWVHSVRIDGDDFERIKEVPASKWERGDWLGHIAAHAWAAHGQDRGDVLRAVRLFAQQNRPAVRWRHRYTGWVEHEGEWVYVTPGVCIGARGVVQGVESAPSGIAAKYALPSPPEGAALEAALDAVHSFAASGPATTVLTLIGAAFRATLGPARVTVHVSGRGGLRKTTLVQTVTRFFGANIGYLSWSNGISDVGLTRTSRIVGDAPRHFDDLRLSGTSKDDKTRSLFETNTRMQYDRVEEAKGKRDSQDLRESSSPRSLLLSTGEEIPQGFTSIWRVLTVDLNEQAGVTLEMIAAAERGVYAQVTAAFVKWLALRMGKIRADLVERDLEAAQLWKLSGNDRTVQLAGEIAHGWLVFEQFLAEVSPRHREAFLALDPRRALAVVVAAQGGLVADEDAGPRALQLVGEGLRAGTTYVLGVSPTGRFIVPPNPLMWGFQEHRTTDGVEWRPRSAERVGYVRDGEVYLEPGPLLRIARKLGQQDGHPLAVSRRTLGKALEASGLLLRRDVPGFTAMVRVGGGAKVSAYVVHPSALGLDLTEGSDEPAGSGGEP